MSNSLPVIGACLPVEELATYRDWLIEKDRDLEIQSFTQPDVLDGDWRPLAEEAKRRIDGHRGRVGIHGPFWGLDLGSADPEIRKVVTRRILQGLDVCEALDARVMVLHSPFSRWTYNNFPRYGAWRSGVYAAMQETLAPAVARAADQGVVIALENIEDTDPMERVEVARSFDSPAIAVSLDTGHAECARGVYGAPPVDYYVRAAGSLLAHVHLQDADGYADRHWAIGEGTIRWHSVFRALAEVDANPHLVLELRDYARIPAAMAYLEREGLGQ